MQRYYRLRPTKLQVVAFLVYRIILPWKRLQQAIARNDCLPCTCCRRPWLTDCVDLMGLLDTTKIACDVNSDRKLTFQQNKHSGLCLPQPTSYQLHRRLIFDDVILQLGSRRNFLFVVKFVAFSSNSIFKKIVYAQHRFRYFSFIGYVFVRSVPWRISVCLMLSGLILSVR